MAQSFKETAHLKTDHQKFSEGYDAIDWGKIKKETYGMEPRKEWITSLSEENWTGAEEYATKEEAIKYGPEEYGLDVDESFYVGRKVHYQISPIDAETLLEDMICQDDDLGDWADFWQGQLLRDKEVAAFATKKLQEIADFINRECPADFFIVRDVEAVSIDETPEYLKESSNAKILS